jgi:hypothetical protein
MAWEEYLDRVRQTRSIQQKRFDEARKAYRPRFEGVHAPARFLILSMPRCGDCIWAVPHLMAALDLVEGAEARIFFRDEHEELMDLLETGGKRAVPKLAMLNPDGEIAGTWGPRPEPIQQYVQRSLDTIESAVWKAEVLRYYRAEGRDRLADELLALIESGV